MEKKEYKLILKNGTMSQTYSIAMYANTYINRNREIENLQELILAFWK